MPASNLFTPAQGKLLAGLDSSTHPKTHSKFSSTSLVAE